MLFGRPDSKCQTLQNSIQKPESSVFWFKGKTGGWGVLGHLIGIFCSTYRILTWNITSESSFIQQSLLNALWHLDLGPYNSIYCLSIITTW